MLDLILKRGRLYVFCLLLSLILEACTSGASASNVTAEVIQTSQPTLTRTPWITLSSPTPPSILPPSPTATIPFSETPAPTLTPTASQTPLPSPTSTSTWIWTEAGQITVPILLYHHIAESAPGSRYYVSPEIFEDQMNLLHRWGYTTILPTLLVQAIISGAELPEHPIIITFDDGDVDVYENAFPIMQSYNYCGVFYIVSSYLNAEGFITPDQLKEMAEAGWEIGSHSMTHANLTLDHSQAYQEMRQSALDIEAQTGLPVHTFAYPFGSADSYLLEKAVKYGYKAAMGLGPVVDHNLGSLYYLNRREVLGNFSLQEFSEMLPWQYP